MPPLAYLPLVVIWFGIDENGEDLVVIYLACFAPIAMAARAGVRSATIEQIHAAYSLGGRFGQIVRHVVLPAALPEILTGLRIAIGFGWTTLVAAEMVVATAGLGQMVLNASSFLRTDVVVMGIVLIGLIAWLFDLGMRALERRLVPWKARGSQPQPAPARATSSKQLNDRPAAFRGNGARRRGSRCRDRMRDALEQRHVVD